MVQPALTGMPTRALSLAQTGHRARLLAASLCIRAMAPGSLSPGRPSITPSSSIFMMIWGMMPLGVLPAGLLAEAVSGQFAVGVMATLLILVTFVLWATQKQLRNHM